MALALRGGMLHTFSERTYVDPGSKRLAPSARVGGRPRRARALDTRGRIIVNATNSLDASVRGSGAILYRGNPPHMTKSVTGSGAITST